MERVILNGGRSSDRSEESRRYRAWETLPIILWFLAEFLWNIATAPDRRRSQYRPGKRRLSDDAAQVSANARPSQQQGNQQRAQNQP